MVKQGINLATNNMILVLFLFLIVLFSSLSPSFFTLSNIISLFNQNTSTIIMAVGLTFIILSGGIDLSIGYQLSLVSVVIGWLMTAGASMMVASTAGILVGILCGAFNAVIIIYLKIPPFAATIGSQIIFRAISYLLSGGRAYTKIQSETPWLLKSTFLNIPNYVLVAVVCLIVYGILSSFTYFGTYVKAVGENEQGVKNIGINVNGVKLLCYVLGSFFFSIQALLITYKQGVASPSTGNGFEIAGIIAVFLGIDSSYSNKSNNFFSAIFHLLTGVMILSVLENGMLLNGWNQYIQLLISGLLFIFAVTFYNYRKTYRKTLHDE